MTAFAVIKAGNAQALLALSETRHRADSPQPHKATGGTDTVVTAPKEEGRYGNARFLVARGDPNSADRNQL